MFSRNELLSIIKSALGAFFRIQPITVFAACNVAQNAKFFVRAVYTKGNWCFTDLNGDVLIEGTDFVVCT